MCDLTAWGEVSERRPVHWGGPREISLLLAHMMNRGFVAGVGLLLDNPTVKSTLHCERNTVDARSRRNLEGTGAGVRERSRSWQPNDDACSETTPASPRDCVFRCLRLWLPSTVFNGLSSLGSRSASERSSATLVRAANAVTKPPPTLRLFLYIIKRFFSRTIPNLIATIHPMYQYLSPYKRSEVFVISQSIFSDKLLQQCFRP